MSRDKLKMMLALTALTAPFAAEAQSGNRNAAPNNRAATPVRTTPANTNLPRPMTDAELDKVTGEYNAQAPIGAGGGGVGVRLMAPTNYGASAGNGMGRSGGGGNRGGSNTRSPNAPNFVDRGHDNNNRNINSSNNHNNNCPHCGRGNNTTNNIRVEINIHNHRQSLSNPEKVGLGVTIAATLAAGAEYSAEKLSGKGLLERGRDGLKRLFNGH